MTKTLRKVCKNREVSVWEQSTASQLYCYLGSFDALNLHMVTPNSAIYDVGNATLTTHPPTILHNCYTLECNLWDFNRFDLVCKILIDLNEILRAGKLIMYYKDSSLP
jgi:hypothetical protein